MPFISSYEKKNHWLLLLFPCQGLVRFTSLSYHNVWFWIKVWQYLNFCYIRVYTLSIHIGQLACFCCSSRIINILNLKLLVLHYIFFLHLYCKFKTTQLRNSWCIPKLTDTPCIFCANWGHAASSSHAITCWSEKIDTEALMMSDMLSTALCACFAWKVEAYWRALDQWVPLVDAIKLVASVYLQIYGRTMCIIEGIWLLSWCVIGKSYQVLGK